LLADYGGFELFEVGRLTPELATNSLVELHDEYNRILLNAVPLDTSRPEIKALRQALGSFQGRRLHLVHFIGPVQPAWRDQLVATGVRILAYIPHNAYLVYGDADALRGLQRVAASAPHIRWEGAYLDEYKIHPLARPRDKNGNLRPIGTEQYAVQLVADPEANRSTLELLDRLKLEALQRRMAVVDCLNVIVRLAPASLAQVAACPDVLSIQPYFQRRKFCERQAQIVAGNLSGTVPSGPGYLAWLTSKGFTQEQFIASGFAVDLTDSGIDNATTAPNHFGLYTGGVLTNSSRVLYNRLEGSPNARSTLAGCDGHGNLNAHILGGYDDLTGFPFADAAGYHFGLGVCPFVSLGSSVIFDPESFTNPNYNNLQSEAYASGARISNNSWGASTFGAYDVDAQNFDALVRDAQPNGATFSTSGNQEMVVVFAAGNDGPDTESIGSPGTAKNVITVGAAENMQAIGGSDGSGVPDAEANNANDMLSFSSRGPCTDGRHKPELVAPGTHVSGGVMQAPNPGPNGTAGSCFNGSGVSGGVTNIFFPAGQQFYTASSGTSHATPCVSGGCALLRQYFLNQYTNAPSPAMTKAYLMNSARYLTGAYANDTLWSDTQGMGELDLGTAFDGVPRVLRDQLTNDLFTASGQTRTFTGAIANTNLPVRVTLAWTDAPGSTTGDAYNNNLDLTVSVNGTLYKGNVFSGPYSTIGGTADTRNNVESVMLPPGFSGMLAVKVIAANINSDGVPNNAQPLDQDFALVIYNATPVTAPVIGPGAPLLVAETCLPTNGVIDPGETVTLNFALQNIGTADTTNLVATLQANAGVIAPSAPQNYGVLPADSAAVSRAFSFTVNGSCGGTVTATLALRDGTVDLPSLNFHLQLGQLIPTTTFGENFDAVSAPSLPPNWLTSASGAESGWVTSVAAADTGTNSAYVSEPDQIGLADLVSPRIPIVSAFAQLTFRQSYDLEADPVDPKLGYDGGVLELRIGKGQFTDILAAGGSFATGGYTRTIDPTDDNFLDGRQVWSGNSGGFITTVVNLPPAVAGQAVSFRWRFGTDTGNFYGGTGWYIDSISLQDGYYSCCGASPVPTVLNPKTSGTGFSFSFQTIAGQPYTVEYSDTLTGSNWTSVRSLVGDGSIYSFTDTIAAPQRFYRVRSP
jgi:hypothetical protein